MTHGYRFAGRAIAIVLTAAVAQSARTDCGSIPYSTPFFARKLFESGLHTDAQGRTRKDLRFEPADVVVYEPGQRAIILWNGEEETLLLSTDIQTNVETPILEVMPFPSEPEVTQGDFSTFEKMQKLLIEKSMWRVASGGGVAGVAPKDSAATITFHEQMGANDVSVVRVDQPEHFRKWVIDFLRTKDATNPAIRTEFLNIIENYLERDIRWFVFNTIIAGESTRSKQPLQFRFTTDEVYYPLEISSLETGDTTVDLLLLTKSRITTYDELGFAVEKHRGLSITRDELAAVLDSWAGFMEADEIAMQRVQINGALSSMTTDFRVR